MTARTDTAAVRAGGPAVRGRLPRSYRVWLVGMAVSMLGTQIMGFGMAWQAARTSASLAATILVLINGPRVLLLLFGGAFVDRFGAWRTLLIGECVMASAVLTVAAIWSSLPAHNQVLLLGVATVIGLVDAFYLPASGVMPKRLAPDVLSQAFAARQGVFQATMLAGPPLGGLLTAAVGFRGVAAVNGASFLVMIATLLWLAPVLRHRPVPAIDEGLWRAVATGLRYTRSDVPTRQVLVVVTLSAAFVLAAPGLLLPVLGVERGWSATLTGVVVAAFATGTIVVSVLVSVRGGSRRPGRTSVIGVFVSGTGAAVVGAVGSPIAATVGAALAGAGIAIFGSHAGPLVLGRTPDQLLSRVQSIVTLAQSVPLLLAYPLLGVAADRWGSAWVLLACGCITMVIAGGVSRLEGLAST